MKKFKIILAVILSFVAIAGYAQSKCKDKIQQSEKLYENGEYSKVVNILKSVLEECDLSKIQKNEVVKYLASSYFEMDELEEADKYMVKFIKKNPYYEVNMDKDPYAFREELDKFKTWPLFSIGFGFGIPINNIVIEKIYPVIDMTIVNYNQEIKSTQAVSFALEFGWNINKYLSVNLKPGVTLFSLTQSIPMYTSLNFNYKESVIQTNIPFFLKFSYPLKNGFVPALYLGAELIQLSEVNYSYDYTQDGAVDQQYEFLLVQRKKGNTPIEDLEAERNVIRRAAFAGARISYRLNSLGFYVDLKYRRELDLYNKPDQRYFHPELFITNNYVLPDFKIETYEISLGVNFNFAYKVKSKY